MGLGLTRRWSLLPLPALRRRRRRFAGAERGSRAVKVVLNRLCERVVLNRRARFRLIKLILVVKGSGRGWWRRRFAGAERGSRFSHVVLNPCCERVRATKHAPREPFRVIKRRRGLAEIVERGAGVHVERHRVNCPRPEREIMTFSENASRHGHRFAQHRFGLFNFKALMKEK